MALDTILEKLDEERARLTKELNRVVNMIRAAGKGAEAAVQEYGRRNKAPRRAKTGAGATKKRKISAASRRKMAEAQRARRFREQSATKAKKAPTAGASKMKAKPSALAAEPGKRA